MTTNLWIPCLTALLIRVGSLLTPAAALLGPVGALLGPVNTASADAARTMRVDFYHTGSATQELFSLDRVVVEPLAWPGNPARAIDESNLGTYFFEVTDLAEQRVLYSRGFDSIYGEWVTTAEARQVNRTFHESLRFPAPAAPVRITVRKREGTRSWTNVWDLEVDPQDKTIDTSIPAEPGPLIEIVAHGPSPQKVDLLILGDGYRADERTKFESDARRLVDRLLTTSPFRERQSDFNVWGLCPVARDSGISRPSTKSHKASPLGSTYDAFGLDRYILTFDNKSLRQTASFAPYDFVQILCNGSAYGGGGIFQLYGTVAADNTWAAYVFIHELGHHVAALADEYYTSPVAYLPTGQRFEPWQPNVTALLDPTQLKWKDLVARETPLPTPWRKAEYDTRAQELRNKTAQLRKEGAPEVEIDTLLREHARLDEQTLSGEAHAGKVGAFEGANYASTGYYRPAANCIMFTRTEEFCPVCRRAIERIIDQYSGTGPAE